MAVALQHASALLTAGASLSSSEDVVQCVTPRQTSSAMPRKSSDDQSVGASSSSSADMWGAVEPSDVTLILNIRPDVNIPQLQQPPPKKVCRPQRNCALRREQKSSALQLDPLTSVFTLHTARLSAESSYFEARFSRWAPESSSSVTETLENSSELEAARHVLKFMYTTQLPTHGGLMSDSMLFLDVIKVSRH